MKRMKDSLRVAVEIREQLKGRNHSDNTELLREDRSSSNESLAERELTLESLVSNVTETNRHAEIDSGPPIGEEEW